MTIVCSTAEMGRNEGSTGLLERENQKHAMGVEVQALASHRRRAVGESAL